mmetsp:Transcript_15634/g.19064  ORF Transcript_15634/g.19064 Transcript_15634/m.19064 type:complete len:83 (+) Transcript_15634:616-864(+)
MTKSQLMPIKIAKHIDSKNPSVHPSATRVAVVATRTYKMEIDENSVKMKERDAIRTTRVENPIAIPAAPNAVCKIFPFVSYQ